jgi:hypothetical protein
MAHTLGATTAVNGGAFVPKRAADTLEQATRRARRQLPPALFVFRAVTVLVAFGRLWLSVRGQDPYTGPSGPAIAVAVALVAANCGWSVWAIKRAGVSRSAFLARRALLGVKLVALVAAYAVIVALYHAGASHPVWGLYPASAPLLIVGVVCAVTAAASRDWLMAGACLAVAVVATAAGFGGPAGAWLIMSIGLCAVMLGTAAVIAWQRRRSTVRP